MTFPAELAFKRDTSLSPSARRVYDYLTTVLDFREARRIKVQIECESIGTDRETFSNGLDALVAAGYLKEHRRDQYNVRKFTLMWSLGRAREQLADLRKRA